MKQGRKHWLGGLALALGTLGAGLLLRRDKAGRRRMTKELPDNYRRATEHDRWARPGMFVTFRAEVMPSRDRTERTFRVVKLLPSGRVQLEGGAGEHTESEFEPLR